jgi:Ca2+-binding EF-hand superfamily protein
MLSGPELQKRVEVYMMEFEQIDTEKTGRLTIERFSKLFDSVMGGDTPDGSAAMYFKGIDIDNNRYVERDEFREFVVASLKKDLDYVIKMAFRAFDRDANGLLDADEIRSIARYIGMNLTDEQLAESMKKVTKKEGASLTFANVVKLITGRDIDPNTDPYDGKKATKSGCCLLT